MFREEPYTNMEEMFNRDAVAVAFGMRLIDLSPGHCRLSLIVKHEMLNAYGAAHGAVVYALADVAFALACNSRGVKSVGLSMNIHYRRPVSEREQLTAEAWEESLAKTTSLCRIRVTNDEGKVVALADGLAYNQRK